LKTDFFANIDYGVSGSADSRFIAALIRGNRLERLGFERFVFYGGMLYAAADKWWGTPGRRHARHEGIDLCFFRTRDGRYCRLDHSIAVPMAADSRIVHIMDDFLGQTVVARWRVAESAGRELLTIYAHIQPVQGLAVGDRVEAGYMFARIADVKYPGSPMPPHLHISMAWADQLPEYRRWSWKLLNKCGSERFIDPLDHINIPYTILTSAAGMDPAAEYTPCRHVLSEL